MCLNPIKVKSVSEHGLNRAYVPCGKCKDCRNAYKSGWALRLSCELQACQAKGWYVCFCTLTYNDENLPRVPQYLITEDMATLPACFNRNHVRKFIVNIRRALDKFYCVHGLRYMVCSEYGSYTKRPHYHCIFAVDPACSPENFFELVKKYWVYGFVFPKAFTGGLDGKGYMHQPFLVKGTARFAGAYCAKYCVKDLDFVNSLKDVTINTKSKDWRIYQSFHVQSQSLGLSYLVGKSSDEIRDIFFKGISFVGDKNIHQLPVYFRNKILFNPLYVCERRVYKGIKLLDDTDLFTQRPDDILEAEGYRVEYKRLVRREATQFFYENREEVFNRRVEFWSKVFGDFITPGFLESKGFSNADADRYRISYFSLYGALDSKELGSYMVGFFGLKHSSCFDIAPVDNWFLRYANELPDLSDLPLISQVEYDTYNSAIDYILSVLGMVYSDYTEDDKKIAYLQDKHKSEVY